MLGVVGHHHIVADLSSPLIQWKDAREHLQHGGLASAVRSDQGDTVATRKLQVHAAVDHVITVGFARVGKPDDLGTSRGGSGNE